MNRSMLTSRRLAPFMLVILLFASLASILGETQRTSAQAQSAVSHDVEKEAGQHGTPLESLLNVDGTLNLGNGFTGSLDPTGWELVEGEGGEPRFMRTQSAEYSRGPTNVPGDENWDDRFSLEGASNQVLALAFSGSDLYVGGNFSTVGGIVASRIAKWNGSQWSALGGGVSGTDYNGVNTIAIVGNAVYVGGRFSMAGNVPVNNIARWDGTAWHALGEGVIADETGAGIASAMTAIGTDLYVAGRFTMAGNLVANHIAMWDGSQWSTLGEGANNGVDGNVFALAVDNGDIYVGGRFDRAGDLRDLVNNIARWDGSHWYALGTGVSGPNPFFTYIYALATNGNDLYAGGNFTQAGDVDTNNIARWNGSSWTTLGSGVTGSDFTAILTMVFADGYLYIGGELMAAGGTPANDIARWDGSQWDTLGSGIGDSTNDRLFALAINNDKVYVGGRFTRAGYTTANHIAVWDGSRWDVLMHGTYQGIGGNYVFAITVSGDSIYVGGHFSSVGTVEANNIARWDRDGWHNLDSGVDGSVMDIAVRGSDVYVGGLFSRAGGTSAYSIARWDGSQWYSVGGGMYGSNNLIHTIAIDGNNVYAGGVFSYAGGVLANHIARWDGTQWHSLGSGVANEGYTGVHSIAISDGILYAGGRFDTAGDIAVHNVAAWNGNQWVSLGDGTNDGVDNSVNALAISGKKLYVGGRFTMAGGVEANHVAMWDGSHWSSLGVGVDDEVYALAISGSKVYAGGEFTLAGGMPTSYIAIWDGSQWSTLGSGVNRAALALKVIGKELYVGGEFSVAGNKPSSKIGIWYEDCPMRFSDVLFNNTFYLYVRCLACQGILSGYGDGTFRPNNPITRGQLSKIVSNASAFNDPPGEQLFEDVAPESTFYEWVQRLGNRGIMGGYPCGGEGEPCGLDSKPYFRPNVNATRGQISKILSNAAGFSDPPGEQLFEDVPPGSAFYDWVQRLGNRSIMGGYPCGSEGEPCVAPDNRPYFRPSLDATRGQVAKITANTFFPNCNPPSQGQ